MSAKTVSILGCGWLGFPLGQHLLERGHRVKGSTTDAQKLDVLEEAGIEAYLLELDPLPGGDEAGDFFDADVLFLNIPPPRAAADPRTFHRRQVEAVLHRMRAASVDFVVYASSTSVYPSRNEVVEEEDAEAATDRGALLLEAEQTLQHASHVDATILRFSGLYGYDRHPARYLAGKKKVENGEAPVNLIHRDDCIGVVTTVIEQEVRREVFNVTSDEHPKRRVLYETVARRHDLDPPSFVGEAPKPYKIVSNRKLKEVLKYTFQYPDPLDDAP